MESATPSVLKAASHVFIVQPSTVDSNESRRQSGLFVAGDEQKPQLYRGVILDIGSHVDEPNAEIGGVILYSAYVPEGVGEGTMHVVAAQYALAFES